jgi:hypothetical protein
MPSIINSTTTNGIVVSGDNSGSLQLASNNGTTAVTIDGSQNVGIGTTSPACKLEVGGLIRATSLTNPSSGSGVELGYDGTQGVVQAFSNRATNTVVPINIQGDLKMNSGYGSSAIAYGCRAWVNFDGTGTPAIRASGNVSSITDGGTGVFTVNFTNALPDVNYSVSLTGRYSAATTDGRYVLGIDNMNAGSCKVVCLNVSDTALLDPVIYCCAFFR